MKNKSTIGHQSRSLLLIFGMTVALLFSTSSQIVLASPQRGIPGTTDSNSNQGAGSANKCTPYKPCGPEDQPNNAEQSEGGSQGTAPTSYNSSGASSNPNQQAIDHISQAQSALQNGDTEGAQRSMNLAKNALICNPGDPAHC